MRRPGIALAAFLLLLAAACVATASSAHAHATVRPAVTPLAGSDGMSAAIRDPGPAHAATTSHTQPRADSEAQAEQSAPSRSTAAWLALAVPAVAAAARWARLSRRGLAVGLAPLLIVLAVESSIHAVHHLGDRASASECSVAGATAHLAGTVVDFAAIDPRSGPALSLSGPLPRVAEAADSFRPDAGRAPPSA